MRIAGKSTFQALTLALSTTCASISPSFAADTVVASGATVAQQVLAPGDTLTVESGGVVTDADSAVLGGVFGPAMTVTNNGTIISTLFDGIDSDDTPLILFNNGTISGRQSGVFGFEITSIVNNGTIDGQVNGVSGALIDSLTNNGPITGVDTAVVFFGLGEFTNTGSLTSTAGDAIDGLFLGSFNNSGTITGDVDGVFVDTILTMVNTGTIIGTNANGVNVVDLPFFNNSGVIRAQADGIDSDGGDSFIINSGTITSIGSQGIDIANGIIFNSGTVTGGNGGIEIDRAIFAGDATITNSGFIGDSSGPGGTAIDFQFTGTDTLNLLAGSVLVGAMNWDGTNDTLNLGAGLDVILTMSNAPNATSFASPFAFLAGNVAVQVDLSAASALDDVLSDLSGAVGNSVQARVDSAFATASAGASGHGQVLPKVEAGYEPSAGGHRHGATYWGSVWGVGSEQDSTSEFAETRHVLAGSVSGVDWRTEEGGLAGVYGGGAMGEIDVLVRNGQNIDVDSYYAGAYGRWMVDDISLDARITAGWMDFDSTRYVANNLVAGGVQNAAANFDGFFVAPQLNITSVAEFAGMTILPSAQIGYAGMFLDGYSETGSAANVTMDRRNIHTLNARLQIAALHDMQNADGSVTNLRPYIGIEGDAAFGDTDTVTASVLGNTLAVDIGRGDSALRGFAGMQFTRPLTDNSHIFGGFEAGYGSGQEIAAEIRVGWSASF